MSQLKTKLSAKRSQVSPLRRPSLGRRAGRALGGSTGFCRNDQESEQEVHKGWDHLRPAASNPSLTQESEEQRPQDGDPRRGVASPHLEMTQRASPHGEAWVEEWRLRGRVPQGLQGKSSRGAPAS